jgi:tetratricopeptide (TPR) repeat protein
MWGQGAAKRRVLPSQGERGGVLVRQEDRTRLKGWKEIAAFFEADVRTVKRWESARGLPIHRPPGEARASVFAYADELSRWLDRTRPVGEPAPEPPASAPADEPIPERPETRTPQPTAAVARNKRLPARLVWAMVFAVLLCAGSALLVSARQRTGAVTAERQALYETGVYYLQTRTARGLNLAARYLTGAIAREPGNAAAYARLGETYEMMNQFADMPADEAHARAREAAERALAINPKEARAFAVLGFAAWHADHNLAGARRFFNRAIALDPQMADAHLWYAMVLMHAGDQREPLREIARAQAIDPQSRTILANRALIEFHAGNAAEAIAILREMRETDPALRSPPEYLATIYMAERRWADFIREARAAAGIAGDQAQLQDLDIAAKALASGGERAMLAALYRAKRDRYAHGEGSAMKLAQYAALAGDRQASLHYLSDSVGRGDPDAVGLLLEPALRPLHGDPRFQALVRRLGLPLPGGAGGAVLARRES